MMAFDHSKLRGRIVEKFGTYNAFFKQLDITNVQASRKLNGKADLSRDDIVQWCGLLDIDLKDVGQFFYALKV